MKKTLRAIVPAIVPFWAACLVLAGCSIVVPQRPSASAGLFDLGPVRPAPVAVPLRLPPLTVADVQGPTWLETPQMFYRLDYVNGQQPQPYAANRWATPPLQLFGQRVRARLTQAGGVALLQQDGAANAALLRMEADDFSQHFSAPGQSLGVVTVRASVFDGRTLVAQKSFSRQASAPSADAAGGVRALADASDAVIVDMMAWLAGLRTRE